MNMFPDNLGPLGNAEDFFLYGGKLRPKFITPRFFMLAFLFVLLHEHDKSGRADFPGNLILI